MVKTQTTVREIVRQKLAAFEQLRPEYERCFRFVQEAHGQKRLTICSIAEIVYYLHARWVCDSKGELLSVPHSPKRLDGKRCLELLRDWQINGESAEVIAFLQYRLDTLPFADLTRQIDLAEVSAMNPEIAQRLRNGRRVLLNRGFNLLLALDAIGTLSHEEISSQVRLACERYGHLPKQIKEQLALAESPLFSYVPHQELARYNMLLMNTLTQDIRPIQEADKKAHMDDPPATQDTSQPPLAEFSFPFYQELTSTDHNNVMRHRFYNAVPMSAARS
ncbi:hypothetical protein [Ktedonospora formicarum]|uniref:Uncharacterized protein n=1 Tax=Ktedonospora formicarum TaxID=2778364 RepID=A0A8J3I0U0_9CHLR|nr:hypothetical protein [Ktedonospora formicarum]GHO45511.1 hypothetical protein KSX_36740 [Ktedonospora formicarum]